MSHIQGVKSVDTLQRGLSLVELMISAVIGMILLAGVIQIYLSNRQSFQLQSSVSYVQQASRYAIEFIANDVRRAGFNGCVQGAEVSVVNNVDIDITSTRGKFYAATAAHYTGLASSLQGFTSSSFPNDMLPAGDTIVAGSEALLIQGPRQCLGGTLASGGTTLTEYKVQDLGSCAINENDIVYLTDCADGVIHVVTNDPQSEADGTIKHDTNMNKNEEFSKIYGVGSALYRFESTLYYIGLNGANNPALYRHTLAGGKEELVEGVYGLNVLYGLDSDPSDGIRASNRYVSAADMLPANWANVTNLTFSLDIRSTEDDVTNAQKSYSFNGSTTVDNRLHRHMLASFSLRNRVVNEIDMVDDN